MANVLSSLKNLKPLGQNYTPNPTTTAASTSPISKALESKKTGSDGIWGVVNRFGTLGSGGGAANIKSYIGPGLQGKVGSDYMLKDFGGYGQGGTKSTTPTTPTVMAQQTSTPTTPTAPVTSPTTPPATPLGTATQGLMDIGKGTTPATQDIQGLRDIAASQTPAVTEAQKAYNQFMQSSPYMQAAQYNPNVAADIASGRSSLLGQVFGQIASAKQAAVANALAGQGQQISAGTQAGQLGQAGLGQQISALQGAGGLSQPVSQFGVLGTPQSVGAFGNISDAAFAGGQIGARQAQGMQYGQAESSLRQGATQVNALQGLIQGSGISLTDYPAINTLLQSWAREGKSSPNYQKLNNILTAISKSFAPILGQEINIEETAKSSGKTILDVINDLQTRATQQAEAIRGGTSQAPSSPVAQSGSITWDNL